MTTKPPSTPKPPAAAKPPSQAEAPTSALPITATVPEAKDLLFLVVDDDSGVRKTILEYLISFGFSDIREASNGLEALQVLERERVDFVISDWEMPSMNGLDLLVTLRTDDRYKDIPFVMITSPQSKEKNKVARAAQAKVNGYIVKPFRAQVLREKIESLLAHSVAEKTMGDKKGVLLVDDDPKVRETVGEFLREMSYQPIYEACDGEEAWALLQKHQNEIAFVVSDWEMPKLAGIDLLKKIRTESQFDNLPFIMITSQTSIERLKLADAIAAHVDQYLLKPFKMSDLKEKLEKSLSRALFTIEIRTALEQGANAQAEGRVRDAEKAFEHVLKLDRTNVDAMLGLADLQQSKDPDKGTDKAIQYIRGAIKINPAMEKAYIQLSKLFEAARSLEKAIAVLHEGLETCNFADQLHYELARLYEQRGSYDKAIFEAKRAIELKPGFREAQDLLRRLQGPPKKSS